MDAMDDSPSVLPAQYYAPLRSRNVLEGELKLMFVVLQDGINSYLSSMLGRRVGDYRRFQEVLEWITARDESGPFAYETLCDTFGLNPDALRKTLALARTQAREEAGAYPRRNLFHRPRCHESGIGSEAYRRRPIHLPQLHVRD